MKKIYTIVSRIIFLAVLVIAVHSQVLLAKADNASSDNPLGPAGTYEETDQDEVTIVFTLSNDGVPLLGSDGTVLSNLELTIPYFDLAQYDLSGFYRYHTEKGYGKYSDKVLIQRPTALHAFIWIMERYYLGIPEEECGKGTSELLDYDTSQSILYMDGTLAYETGRRNALTITGTPTSMYMKTFWGHDENLMYYRNHQYPLMDDGWGSSGDYILLSDGDHLDAALFTDWSFYHGGGFHQFTKDNYEIRPGESVTASVYKSGTTAGLNGKSDPASLTREMQVAVYDDSWNKIADLEISGDSYSYTFEECGTYYLMALDPNAKDTQKACYAPAVAKVTVAEETIVPGDLNGDGEISMSDVYLTLRYVKGGVDLDDQQRKSADVNGDGEISMSDTYLIYRRVLGKIKAFPIENEREGKEK